MTSVSWHYRSVQEFFGQFNWQGQPQFNQNGQDPSSQLSLQMSVAQFFQAVPWEGTPEVGVLPTSSPVTAAASKNNESDVTLDALLDIF